METNMDKIQIAFETASMCEAYEEYSMSTPLSDGRRVLDFRLGTGEGLSTCHISPLPIRQFVIDRNIVFDSVISPDGCEYEFISQIHEYVTPRLVVKPSVITHYDNVFVAGRRYEIKKQTEVWLPVEAQRMAIDENPRVEVWGDGQFAKVYTGRRKVERNYKNDDSYKNIKKPLGSSPLTVGKIIFDLFFNQSARSSVRFSKKSRKRLMETLAKTKKDVKPLFVTLTYPDNFSDSKTEWKRDIDTLGKRFLRRFTSGSFVWRMELKERLTGNNAGKVAPHFHLLVWGVPRAFLRVWLPLAWFNVVGSGDPKHLSAGTSVERIRSARGVMAYASKYISKIDEAHSVSVGRHWGVIGRDNIPVSEVIVIDLMQKKAIRLLRVARKFVGIKGRDVKTLGFFVDGANFLGVAVRL